MNRSHKRIPSKKTPSSHGGVVTSSSKRQSTVLTNSIISRPKATTAHHQIQYSQFSRDISTHQTSRSRPHSYANGQLRKSLQTDSIVDSITSQTTTSPLVPLIKSNQPLHLDMPSEAKRGGVATRTRKGVPIPLEDLNVSFHVGLSSPHHQLRPPRQSQMTPTRDRPNLAHIHGMHTVPQRNITTTTSTARTRMRMPPQQPYQPTPVVSITSPQMTSPYHISRQTAGPLTIQTRQWLQTVFEKHRRLSYVIQRGKKMELSADMLSRPTRRPHRTEEMDKIMSISKDLSLNGIQYVPKISQFDPSEVADVPVDLSKLTFRQRVGVYYYKARSHSIWFAAMYMALYVGMFSFYYGMLHTPHAYIVQGSLESLPLNTAKTLIDNYPGMKNVITATVLANTTDVMRFCLLLFISWLRFAPKFKGNLMLMPQYYDKIRYKYGLEEPPELHYDVSAFDTKLEQNRVPHPGVAIPEREDHYGRDYLRDLVPKDRVEFEYVLHGWQGNKTWYKRTDKRTKRDRLKKKKIRGSRWSKVGFGIFQAG